MIDNINNKVMIKVPYNKDEFNRHNWEGLYTNSGKKIVILEYNIDFYKNGESHMIGLVEDEDKYNFCVWDENGKSFNPDCDICMVRYETPNYDYITEDDVPDTEEFKRRYENCYYKMSPVEYLRYREFCKDHSNCCRNLGAIGGGISVSFMGTGLGSIVHAKCDICGTEVDITDSENW